MNKVKDPLNLGGLPPLDPPGDDWPVIAAALEQHAGRKRRLRWMAASLAAAATVTLVLGLSLRSPSPTAIPEAETGVAQEVMHPAATELPARSVTSLIALSQQLEGRLRAARSEIGSLPTAALLYQVEIEDMVAQVDEELSMNPESVELWSQRINLLLDIEQLYRNSLRREGQRMASL